MFFWFKKNKNKPSQNIERETPPADTTLKPVADTGSTEEPEPPGDAKQFWNAGMSEHDWIGEMFNEQLKNGAFDRLPGKGKPIEVPSDDIMNSILHHANILPGWLTLQHEIRDQLQKAVLSSRNDSEDTIDKELIEINKKIKKYNNLVPSRVLQKRKITRENMNQQFKLWV